jgi:hypothetical protein
VRLFGPLDVASSIINAGLVQCRVPRLRKDLVYAATEHDVAA